MKHTLRGLAMLLVALSLFGCGSSFSQGKGSSANGDGTPTIPPGTTPSATPGGASNQVTLTMSKHQYTPEDPLLVTIHNGSHAPIWIQSQQTACTSLTVERMANGAWETTGRCAPARAPQSVAIAAGSSTTRRIDYAQGMDTGAGWPTGTYRVTLRYTLSGTASSESGIMVQSAIFAIQ
jgi:hypothetical protein